MMGLERIFGPPMAAPESAPMRRLRVVFISLAMMTGLGIAGIGLVGNLIGRAGAGGLMLALWLLTGVSGLVFFRLKVCRDDRWIEDRGFDASRGSL